MNTPTYSKLAQARAGEQSMIQAEADRLAELKAQELLDQKEMQMRDEQEFIDQIAYAKAKGIEQGSRAGKLDATRMFAQQGFIPGEFAAAAEMENNMIEANEQEAKGLGMQEENVMAAAETQAEDISTKLLEAAMQGADDGSINQTLDKLPIPPQVKAEAAKRFLQKRKEISSQAPAGKQPMKQLLPGTAVERMNSPVTKQAQGIMDETNQRMAQLQQLLNPQQG